MTFTLKALIFAFLVAWLSGCSLAVPVHEAEPPEALDNWGFRVGILEGIAPQVAPPDTMVQSDPSNESLPLMGFRFSFGFLERFEATVDAFLTSLASGGSSIAFKYQWIGDTYFKAKKGNYSQTTIVRFWNGSAGDLDLRYNGTDLQSNHSVIKGNGQDISHLWGYRPSDSFGIYGGPKITLGHIDANYQNNKDGPVLASSGRDFWGGGALGGLFLSPHGEHVGFDFVLELEFMNLPKTYESGRDWYTSFMLSLAVPFSFNSGGK